MDITFNNKNIKTSLDNLPIELLEETFEKGHNLSYKIAENKISDQETIETIANRAMNYIFSNKNKINDLKNYYSYITEVTNKLVDDSNLVIIEDDISFEKIYEDECNGRENPKYQIIYDSEDNYNEKTRNKIIHETINELETNEQTVVMSYYFKNKTIDEIAKELKLTYSQTTSLLLCTNKKIKQKILSVQREKGIKIY